VKQPATAVVAVDVVVKKSETTGVAVKRSQLVGGDSATAVVAV
jgi:hypothetical protein